MLEGLLRSPCEESLVLACPLLLLVSPSSAVQAVRTALEHREKCGEAALKLLLSALSTPRADALSASTILEQSDVLFALPQALLEQAASVLMLAVRLAPDNRGDGKVVALAQGMSQPYWDGLLATMIWLYPRVANQLNQVRGLEVFHALVFTPQAKLGVTLEKVEPLVRSLVLPALRGTSVPPNLLVMSC